MAIWADLFGGGGLFVPDFASGSLGISNGGSGTVITITPPAGKRVKLTSLTVDNDTLAEVDMEIQVNNVSIVSGTLDINLSDGKFVVSYGATGGVSSTGSIQELIGGIDEVFLIRKTSGSMVRGVDYSYETGELR